MKAHVLMRVHVVGYVANHFHTTQLPLAIQYMLNILYLLLAKHSESKCSYCPAKRPVENSKQNGKKINIETFGGLF